MTRSILGWPALRALLAAAALGVAAPAQAQWFGWRDGPLPPGAIMRRLMREGFVEVGPPRFDGRAYIVDSVDARGRRVRLVIDAFDGELISRRSVEAGLLPQRNVGPGRGRSRDAFEEADEPAPPFDPRQTRPRRAERPEQAAPSRKTAKVEQPPARAAKPAAPAARAVEPKTTPDLPAEAAAPKTEPAPAPTAAIGPAEPAKPETWKNVPTPSPSSGAAQEAPAVAPSADAAGSPRPVRIIEGVAPVTPHPGEPPKLVVEEPPTVEPPTALE